MMNEINTYLSNSIFFGLFLTLSTFFIGVWVHKKTKFFLFSPLIVSTILCISVLLILNIPYKVEAEGTSKVIGGYFLGANFIHYMLTPVTVCLAVPLYRQFQKLKDNWLAILLGILSGVLANAAVVLGMCILFKIGHKEYVSLLPKSITTAIALGVTEQYEGIASITVIMVTIAGNLGNLFAEVLARIFHITDPVARGVAIGTSSHALGTAKAIELGEVEGAMSGLSIAVTGVITVAVVPFFANLI